MRRRRKMPSPTSPAPYASAVNADDFVTITESNVTRAVFRHSSNPSGGVPVVFDADVTLDSRIVIEDVQLRARGNLGFDVVWLDPLSVTIDEMPREAVISARARRRVSQRLVNLLVESDLGAELP